MDFQLKTLTSSLAASEKADALIFLVPEGAIADNDALSMVAAAARLAGDLPDKAGKLLSLYHPVGIAAPRVMLASIGNGQPAQVRTAVVAAVNAAKGVGTKRLAVVFAKAPEAGALHSAML